MFFLTLRRNWHKKNYKNDSEIFATPFIFSLVSLMLVNPSRPVQHVADVARLGATIRKMVTNPVKDSC